MSNYPGVLTEEELRKWLASLNVPSVTDVTKTAIPETFYVTFNGPLMDVHKAQLTLIGLHLTVDDSNYGVSRYLVTFKGL